MGSAVLYQETDGTSHDIELPPTSKVNINEVRHALHLPDYVDLSSFVMERTAVSLWVAMNAPGLLGELAYKKKIQYPLSPLLVGGAAVKMLCPSANEATSPFNRNIKDVDFVTPRDQGTKLVYLLTSISTVAGTRYHYFLTKSDQMFNAMRAGERYRIRTVDWTTDGKPLIKNADILADKIELRHTIRFSASFESPQANLFTVGAERLLLSKAQLITEAKREAAKTLENTNQTFRLLPYPHYRSERLLVGMEEKDVMDVCALLLDLGVGGGGIDAQKIREEVGNDVKFLLTLRLNLENIVRNSEWLRSKGLTEAQVQKLGESLDSILRALPPVDKKWSKPWWNTDVETPVFG